MKINREEQKKTEQVFYIIGACGLGFALILYLLYQIMPVHLEKFFMPCMFKTVTGLYCPGCGGTRAAAALFKGKFLLSFLYHPIVPYTAVIYIWYMFSHSLERLSRGKIKAGMSYRDAYLWIALGLVAGNFLVKNLVLLACRQDILQMLWQYW